MKTYFVCIALSLLLAACSGSSVKDTLGISRSAPDEFRVVARPPLSVPPQFNLRPPSSSAESPIVTPADKQAQSIVLGVPGDNSGNRFTLQPADTAVTPVTAGEWHSKNKPVGSSAESQLLKNAGAERADPAVRQVLVEEKIPAAEKEEEAPWWQIWDDSGKKEPLVNAKGESDRIKQNTDQGKPITEGETPQTKGKDTGVLGNIFGY